MVRGWRPPAREPSNILAGPSFDDDHVGARQRQLGRQHHPGRSGSCNHDRMIGHRRFPGTFRPSADRNALMSQLPNP